MDQYLLRILSTSASILDLLINYSFAALDAASQASTLDLLKAFYVATSASILDLLNAFYVAISAATLDRLKELSTAISASILDLRNLDSAISAQTLDLLKAASQLYGRGQQGQYKLKSIQIYLEYGQCLQYGQ